MKRISWRLFFLLSVLLGTLVFFTACSGDDDDDNDDDTGNVDTSDVPVPEGCTGKESVGNGKIALAEHDLDEADFQFGCAWSNKKDDAAAAFWYALSMLAVMKDDASLNGLAERAGGHGSTNLWDFTYTFDFIPEYPGENPGNMPFDTPTSEEILATAKEAFGPVLVNISTLLSVTAENPSFAELLPIDILYGTPLLEDYVRNYEIDLADVQLLRALTKLAQGALTVSQAWNISLDIDDFYKDHKDECLWMNDLLDEYPDLLTLLDDHQSALNSARQDAETAMEHYRDFILAVASETDDQGDDLFAIPEWRIEDALSEIELAIKSLDSPQYVTIDNYWWESDRDEFTLAVYPGAIVENPLDRTLFPKIVPGETEWDKCFPYLDLTDQTDLTMNGVFPGISEEELQAAYYWMLFEWIGYDFW